MSVNRGTIRSIYGRCRSKMRQYAVKSGQALPITLGALALGIMVVAPFLTHASTNMVSALNYNQAIEENYAADAGIQYGIWKLGDDKVSSQLEEIGSSIELNMDQEVNRIIPAVEIDRIEAKTDGNVYRIQSIAGSSEITAVVKVEKGPAEIISWDIDKITSE